LNSNTPHHLVLQ